MGIDTRIVLEQRLSQRLVMTPQLRQAIKILQVSRAELEGLIDEELAENPLLEEQAEATQEGKLEEVPTVDGQATPDEWDPQQPEREVDQASSIDQIDWREYAENYANDDHSSGVRGSRSDDDENERRSALENTLTKRGDLVDHLMWQLRLSSLSDPEKELGALIIGCLDPDGYLTLRSDELAFLANIWPHKESVDVVLRRIQRLDPPGVASRDLRECLLMQLEQLELGGDSLPARIVRDHLKLLEGHRFDRLARELDVSVDEVVVAAKAISMLEPKPGRDYNDGDVRYVTPDVYVHWVGDEHIVTLNEDGLPKLRVSRFYRQMLGSDGSNEAKGYIQERMRAAAWLIKSIHQRQRTLYMVTSSIVKFQEEFLLHGISHLRPLVLKDVANDIGMHESTVSRATAGKYVHTPQGTLELKYFFTTGLRSGGGEEVSAESVKKRIREMISDENPKQPFSDQYIAQLLAEEKVGIARRTVAKYRELMGILPSSKRKRVY